MIYIIHGDNASASKKFIFDLLKKDNLYVKHDLDVLSVEPSSLGDYLNQTDLFGKKQFVILDISKLGNKKIDPFLKPALNFPKLNVLVFYADKTLTKTNSLIKASKELNATEMSFPLYSKGNVFRFIDFVFSKKKKEAYSEYQKLLQDDTNVFYIFTMLLYNVRNLSYLVFDTSQKSKMSSSAKTKLSAVKDHYSQAQIKRIYLELYNLDKKVKIGEMDQTFLIPMSIEKII